MDWKVKRIWTKAIKKTIAYRTLSIVSTFGINYLASGQVMIATAATVGCVVVHTLIYYTFERFWK